MSDDIDKINESESNGFADTLCRCGLRDIYITTRSETVANCYYEVALERGLEATRDEIAVGGEVRYVVTFWVECGAYSALSMEALSRAYERIKESKPCLKC
jgi:hypothetical protein